MSYKKLIENCLFYQDSINSLLRWLNMGSINNKELNYWKDSINDWNKRFNEAALNILNNKEGD